MRYYLLLCLILVVPVGLCDTLQIAAAPETVINAPTRGLDMAAVEAQWGAPLDKRPPVGEPPITRWIYDDFVVYFEYDKVLHSVIPKP